MKYSTIGYQYVSRVSIRYQETSIFLGVAYGTMCSGEPGQTSMPKNLQMSSNLARNQRNMWKVGKWQWQMNRWWRFGISKPTNANRTLFESLDWKATGKLEMCVLLCSSIKRNVTAHFKDFGNTTTMNKFWSTLKHSPILQLSASHCEAKYLLSTTLARIWPIYKLGISRLYSTSIPTWIRDRLYLRIRFRHWYWFFLTRFQHLQGPRICSVILN